MSIASRIEQIEQHLTDDYSVLELAGADLTNVNKNIVNLKPTWKERLLYFINNGTDEVYDNWDKVTGEGTSLTLNNTLEAKMKIRLKGNTSQSGTPTPTSPQDIHVVSGDNSIEVCGKNIIGNLITNSRAWANGVIEANNSYSRTSYIPIEPNTTYYITHAVSSNVGFPAWWYDKNYNAIQSVALWTGQYDASGSITSPSNAKYLICNFYNDTITTNPPMLIKGNQPTTYEAFKGASYPINLPEGMELCKIGTYQDKIDKSTGKNLANYLDIPNAPVWSGTTTDSKYIELTLKPNTQYTLSSNVPQGSSTLIYFNGNSTNTNGVWLNNSKTMTTDSNGKIFYALFSNREYYNDVISGKYYIMLNEGSTALPYEPYGTGWYLKKEIGKVVLNGNENWTLWNYSGQKIFYTNVANGTGNDVITNYFTTQTTGGVPSLNCVLYNGNINQNMLFRMNDDTTITTTDGFEEWLSTHNTIVYYILKTPTYETITDTTLISQLEALEKGKSYTGQTNLSQQNNDLASVMNATALEEM